MFEKHVLIIWQPSVFFFFKCGYGLILHSRFHFPAKFHIIWTIGMTIVMILKSAIHAILTLNGRKIKTFDWNLNSKSAWKAHRSVVLRMFWVVLIDLTIWPLGLRTHSSTRARALKTCLWPWIRFLLSPRAIGNSAKGNHMIVPFL